VIFSARSRRWAYYGIPMLFCLIVHWLALKMWFFTDDFAWLGLKLEVQSPFDLGHALFSPQAQGTVRTLSERLFFLVFSWIFGLDSPPFRIWVFLTQFASIALLIKITRRLTGSALAGFLAPVLWVANAAIARAIIQSAVYNEISFAFFVLLGFYLFLKYADTGVSKYWRWQWIVFLLGFGVLELNVMYPALIAGYALCCARRYFPKTLLLFIPSILFTIVHFVFIPQPADAYYSMHFDSGIFRTFWSYWSYAVGSLRAEKADWRPLWLGLALTLLITAALAAFVYRKLQKREWLALFLPAWFVLILLPVLPLKNHFTEYYPAVPAIGLAILAAWAISQSSRPIVQGTAVMLTGLYFATAIADTRMTEKYFYERSRRMKYLVLGLEDFQKQRQRPEDNLESKKIILAGIDSDLYWTGFCDDPFRLLGLQQVFLAPGSEKQIEQHPELGCKDSRYIIGMDDAVVARRRGEAVAFAIVGRSLHDVSEPYFATLSAQFAAAHPDFVDVSDPVYQSRIGPTWYSPEKDFRWMPQTATLKMGGPYKPGLILEITGFCPVAVLEKGPQTVVFRADGIELGTATLKDPNKRFQLQFPLPDRLVGKNTIEISIEVGHTVKAGADVRPLGLIFSTFTMK
jgi:hypothetical protein